MSGMTGLRALKCSETRDFVCESTSCELLIIENNINTNIIIAS